MLKLGFAPLLEQIDGHPQGQNDHGAGVAQLVSRVGRFRIGGGQRQDLRRAS